MFMVNGGGGAPSDSCRHTDQRKPYFIFFHFILFSFVSPKHRVGGGSGGGAGGVFMMEPKAIQEM